MSKNPRLAAFDDLVEQHIKAGVNTAGRLTDQHDHRTWPAGPSFRVVDRALQRLRRVGRIKWWPDQRKWRLTVPGRVENG